MNSQTCDGQLPLSRTETPDSTNSQSEVKHSHVCTKSGDTLDRSNRDSGQGPREVGVMKTSSTHHLHTQTEWVTAPRKISKPDANDTKNAQSGRR